tara:strand:+ start:3601 stop:3834 length:234 start_codon:yes stop_codon:yes gene_type:complete
VLLKNKNLFDCLWEWGRFGKIYCGFERFTYHKKHGSGQITTKNKLLKQNNLLIQTCGLKHFNKLKNETIENVKRHKF